MAGRRHMSWPKSSCHAAGALSVAATEAIVTECRGAKYLMITDSRIDKAHSTFNFIDEVLPRISRYAFETRRAISWPDDVRLLISIWAMPNLNYDATSIYSDDSNGIS